MQKLHGQAANALTQFLDHTNMGREILAKKAARLYVRLAEKGRGRAVEMTKMMKEMGEK